MQAKRNGKLIKHVAFLISLSMYMVSTNSLAQSNVMNVAIQGIEAKKLFTYLTGPKVHADAGMSKQYLQGINVVCQYVTAPISHNGVNVPMGDPSRYSCTMNFDYNGSAAATTLP
ncbi:hypothetical protein [Rickettsiella endosymbiont of Miltochrista miniata]|uniref:hypothetical protein n=1 Tax=Rickettsiella endosymbiont of Miltochrista miniata TaxID=3066239 RepID=UPI00313EB523